MNTFIWGIVATLWLLALAGSVAAAFWHSPHWWWAAGGLLAPVVLGGMWLGLATLFLRVQ